MAVTATIQSVATVVETLSTNVPAATAANAVVTHNQYNQSATLTSATTPPVTQCAHFSKALSSGAGTINLAALTGTNGATVDCTGLKVQYLRFKNPSGNANTISATFGASNPYNLSGSDWKVTLSPGQWFDYYGNDATPDVASGARNIDLAGTGSQTLEVSIIAG